ncbi:MAG: hypothetical protein HY913_04020 [Desulfomonile tiedjei]|nr:hypothetical protein [Desulfomonile tiedjei]
MDETQLTQKQRKWLEASRKIGPGAMTRTERETLERLYADMLPREQQELKAYIEEQFSKKEPEGQGVEDPTAKMERKDWTPPSPALRSALSRVQVLKPKDVKDKS